ncbi:acyloxyacyl hydrolase [Pseudofulvibacter geojedonensis]|uniref:Acyloxyacyl hydrolase n=1 Tax=Pseudofulvibacter geojedonensis TaxID=1123758 RepID=A0ABW3I132_9FLAO
MKKIFSLLSLFLMCWSFAQEEQPTNASTIDVNYFYGTIANHNSDILHLIQGHPEGMILSWNKKTFGKQSWQERFNYPDVGYSFAYQDLKNEYLGKNFSLYAHYNFYFLKRNLMLRIGQGLAYTTNPYDSETNHRNVAFGTHIMSSTYLMLNYKKERLFKTPFGLQAGLSLIHYSNANVKAPNTSINSITANIGITYSLGADNIDFIHTEKNNAAYKEKLGYNIVFRAGINQSDVIGTRQFPFYIPAFYVDKRIGQLSAFQAGAEVFFSRFLKEDIKYNSVAFPERNIDPETDYKRIGLFVGHELFINKLSVETQLGYYVYYPYEFEKRVYVRVGLKRYFGKRYFGIASLKAHGAAAEAVEFGIGMRLGGNKKNNHDE